MAESVRDLVVRLSFQHGDTKSQIAAIKNEIKMLDSGFDAAGQAANGFSSRMNDAGAKTEALRQKLALQNQAVKKYGDAISQAQQRMQKATESHADYGRKLEEAKSKQAALKNEIKQLEAAMKASEKATGDNTEEYIEMSYRLDELNATLEKNGQEIKNLEQGYNRSGKSIVNAGKSIQQLKAAEQEALATQEKFRAELAKVDPALRTKKERLDAAATSLRNFSDAAKSAGDAQVQLGRVLNKGSAAIVGAGVAAGGAAIRWESDFAGVRKTVDGTAEDLQRLEKSLLDMGEHKSADYSDLAGIAANAGQLGVSTKNVKEFTATMADLAETTDMTADSASSEFAQFRNITGMKEEYYRNMGSAVVELGNNLATTESKTVSMAMRIAAAGTQAKMSQADILGVAAGLSSLGIEAEAGGTAFSKAISSIQLAVETGSDELNGYAEVAGMTAESFAQAFREDAAGAFIKFVQGLSSGSESAIITLDKLDITEVRLRDTLLRASNAGDLLTRSIDMSNRAWEENTALANEAEVRYGTTASRMQMLGNRAQRAAIDFGNSLLPVFEQGMDFADGLIDRFAALDDGQRTQIITWGAYAAAAGPAIMLLGKANQGLSAAAGGVSKLLSAASSGGLGGLVKSVGALVGPAGVLALAAGAGIAAYKFYDWASGAKAAREAMEAMNETAREWIETQAETVYDTGNEDPLARFGLNREAFGAVTADAKSWMDELMQIWTDGKTETSEQVNQFADAFASASDSVREKIGERGSLLEGLGTLTPEMQAQMDADLNQLENWDNEIAALLKKRQGGMLSEEDQARLNDVIKLRAELELTYSAGDGSGYESILTGMQAEVERLKAQGEEAGVDVYGDALNALAEGRKEYMDSLNASYDAQYAQISAIEDQATRTAALAALQEQYNARRLEGQNAYNAAVQQAAATTWENTGMREQVQLIDELATMLGGGDIDAAQLAEWTNKLDEGKMASMLALVEQLKASGMDDSQLAQLGIDADDLYSKIQQIRDMTSDSETFSGLNSMFGEALPDEISRIMVGLDMTQASADWEAWKEGVSTFETTGTVLIGMNALDEATIAAWESANAIELTGPMAKVGVVLGADWQSDLLTALDDGLLNVYDGNGIPVTVTPEILNQLTGNDIIALDEDGTYHVIITPEVGSSEGLEASLSAMEVNNTEILSSLGGFSSQDVVDNINDSIAAVDRWNAKIDEMKKLGEGTDSAENIRNGALGNLISSIESLSEADVDNIAGRISNLMAAIDSGTLDPSTLQQYGAELQTLLSVVSAADQYLGVGNNISAGIAQGMTTYGFSSDASSLASSIQSAINTALGIASPATALVPTGENAAAGIAKGLMDYSFASAAESIQSQGYSIGADFGKGVSLGLQSKMQSTVALAKAYASQITNAFRAAWDIHSPSRVAAELTGMFGAGLAEGMKDWPTISERMLEEDILTARRGMQTVHQTTNDSRNFSANSNVHVDKLEVRSEDDIQKISRELARLIQRGQRAVGSR